VIVAEIGIDMSRFETAGHLVSWAGLCPSNDESAGKRRSNRRKKGAPWLKPTLVQCAWAARAPRAATSKPNTTAYAAAAAPKRRSEP
jgi:transposase